MQDRYAGDVGDYVKLALLRALSPGRRLGIAWYLHPNEGHNEDGKHTSYLEEPELWRDLDPQLFDGLRILVQGKRSVFELERMGFLQGIYHRVPVVIDRPENGHDEYRRQWFQGVCATLKDCDLIFADPDNGLVDDARERRNRKNFGKRVPVSETRMLAQNRTVVVYHHNSRFRGGHDAEVDHWISELGLDALAVRATAYTCRTFFILNPDEEIKERVRSFCYRWRNAKVRLHQSRVAKVG